MLKISSFCSERSSFEVAQSSLSKSHYFAVISRRVEIAVNIPQIRVTSRDLSQEGLCQCLRNCQHKYTLSRTNSIVANIYNIAISHNDSPKYRRQ